METIVLTATAKEGIHHLVSLRTYHGDDVFRASDFLDAIADSGESSAVSLDGKQKAFLVERAADLLRDRVKIHGWDSLMKVGELLTALAEAAWLDKEVVTLEPAEAAIFSPEATHVCRFLLDKGVFSGLTVMGYYRLASSFNDKRSEIIEVSLEKSVTGALFILVELYISGKQHPNDAETRGIPSGHVRGAAHLFNILKSKLMVRDV